MTKKKEAPADEAVKDEAPPEEGNGESSDGTDESTSENASNGEEPEVSDKFDENGDLIPEDAPRPDAPEEVLGEALTPEPDAPTPAPAANLLGRERVAPLGHGSHDAAVSGLTTDASGSYVHPSQLKKG